MEKQIRVTLMGQEFPLRIHPDDEIHVRRMAAYVDEKMKTFAKAMPQQQPFTHAVIAALTISEELFETRKELDTLRRSVNRAATDMDTQLAQALSAA